MYYACDPTTALIPKTSKTSPVSLAFFHCLTFSLVLCLLTSTFTAFPIFLWVFRCLEHTNNCYIFSISYIYIYHASTQVLRPITFTQRFRTTRHLFSIQLLWKPKILNVEDKRTKFKQSKGDLGQFLESSKWSLTPAQLSKHIDLRCF